jgi:hypothetical protein
MGFEYLTAEQMEEAMKQIEEPVLIDGDKLMTWCHKQIESIREKMPIVGLLNKYDLIGEYHKVIGEILRMIGGGK